MPYKKIGHNKYVSPSGKKMTLQQIQAYHAKKNDKAKRKNKK